MSQTQDQPRRTSRRTQGIPPGRLDAYVTDMPTERSPIKDTPTAPTPSPNMPRVTKPTTSGNNLPTIPPPNAMSSANKPPLSTSMTTSENSEFKQQIEMLQRQMQIMQTDFINSTRQLQAQLLNTTQQLQTQFVHSQSTIPPQLPSPFSQQSIPASNETEVSGQTSYSHSTNLIPQKKIYPLPIFTGLPEEWQTFSEAFTSTTNECGYTNLHNIMRLREAIKGQARETVESLLANSANVNAIMEMLKETFGRPEQLIRSQIEKVRAIPPLVNDNLDALVNFANKISNMATFLKNVRGEHHLSNPSLLSELVAKLPANRQMQWAEKAILLERPATIIDFSDWLALLRRLANIVHDTLPSNPITSNRRQPSATTSHSRKYACVAIGHSCVICQGECTNIKNCQYFLQLPVSERWNKIKQVKACFCCLKKGHQLKHCSSKRKCSSSDCVKFHHHLLHTSISESAPTSSQSAVRLTENRNNIQNTPGIQPSRSEHRNCHAAGSTDRVLFQILPVKLYGNDKSISTYAFVDDGANVSMLDSNIARQLNMQGQPEVLELQWLNKHSISQKTEKINLTLSGMEEDDRKFTISDVYISSNLSLPVQSCHIAHLAKSSEGKIANIPMQDYYNVQPKLILSLRHSFLTVPLKVPRMLSDKGPIVAFTRLGPIIYGPIPGEKIEPKTRSLHIRKSFEEEYNNDLLTELHALMRSYFDAETLGVRVDVKPLMSKENERALTILKEKTKRITGRYECPLLWKENVPQLPESYQVALDRLYSVERKMSKDREYARQYREKIKDYLEKGYAKRLTQSEVESKSDRVFYLPHFGVKNVNKKGVRLVFDAAAEVRSISLNKALIPGPDLNNSLISIIFKFREAPIAVCGDIQEMFHQIAIAADDRDSQRFLWRDGNVNQPVEVYRMERMIFGATCSPTIAQYVKNLNANNFRKESPRAVQGIVERHYVDDYVDCFQSEEEAISVVRDVIRIHKFGGFNLRNIVSNSEQVKKICGSTVSNIGYGGKSLSSTGVERVLGLHWLAETDVFCFQLKLHKVNQQILTFGKIPTKREMLSLNMSIYDPFGFICDFMITSKVLMQRVWKAGIKWDDELPTDIYSRWKTWSKGLTKLLKFSEPRCYFKDFTSNIVDLHVFVDASEEAMAVVAYWRMVSCDGIKVAFVMGKSSCAPTRYHTTPKLELQAAVMGVRLKELILKSHTKTVNNVYFWSDSYTVIQWIRSDHRVYKQYVANRVSEILDNSKINEWRWCPGVANPADAATRAKLLEYQEGEISNRNMIWQKGPEFLKWDEAKWPTDSSMGIKVDHSESELRSKYRVLLTRQVSAVIANFDRFSQYRRLKRTMAWVNRYVQNLLQKTRGKPITIGELTFEEELKAELYICRYVQQQSFTDEFIDIKQKGFVSPNSDLKMLNPFIDNDELLRVSGRIENATCLSMEAKQPIILPKNHRLTQLLVEYYHKKFYHVNVATTMCEIRQRFWVPSLRQLLNRIQSRCQICKIRRAKPRQPQMVALPVERLTPYVRAFTYTGIDYFGPLNVTIRRKQEKRWIALFTCLSVRAVHLEIASDLTSDACLLCIRNFINRRGVPVSIRSDNGTNFIGIAKELKNINNFLDNNSIAASLTPLGIKWMYNTPANPSEGGVWERLVQSVKKALYIMLKEQAPRLETLQAFLIEAENMTPAPYEPRLMCLRKQWRIAQNLKNGFWYRWIREYLPELTRRTKWCIPSQPLEVGCLVFICDVDQPRSQWKRGRVIDLHFGKDGVARSAEVRTTTGVYRRPVSKLAILDVLVDESESYPSGSVHGGGDVVDGHPKVGNAK